MLNTFFFILQFWPLIPSTCFRRFIKEKFTLHFTIESITSNSSQDGGGVCEMIPSGRISITKLLWIHTAGGPYCGQALHWTEDTPADTGGEFSMAKWWRSRAWWFLQTRFLVSFLWLKVTSSHSWAETLDICPLSERRISTQGWRVSDILSPELQETLQPCCGTVTSMASFLWSSCMNLLI